MSLEKIKADSGNASDSTGDYFGGAWNPFNDMMGDLKRILNNARPDKVGKAGHAFDTVAKAMENSAGILSDAAKRIRDNWEGDAAEAALRKMGEMYRSAQDIDNAAAPTSAALLGQEKTLNHYRAQTGIAQSQNAQFYSTYGTGAMFVFPEVVSPVTLMAANGITDNYSAQDLMKNLQQDTINNNNQFPPHLRSEVPPLAGSQGGYNPPQTGSVPTGPGSLGGGPGGGGPHAGPLPHYTGSPNPGLHTGQYHSGFPGGGGNPGFGGSHSNFPGSGGGGATSLAGFHPAGGGGLGAGGGLGSGGLGAGAGGLSGSGMGGAGLAGDAAAAEQAAMGAAGRGMMPPMGHGGHGGEEKERERSTWLTEDQDVWGADGDAAPPVIG